MILSLTIDSISLLYRIYKLLS